MLLIMAQTKVLRIFLKNVWGGGGVLKLVLSHFAYFEILIVDLYIAGK